MERYDELISGFLATAIIIAILGVIGLCSSCHQQDVWNNGYCDCGGKWTYQQAVGHQYTTGYLYECDKCGKTKEFDKKR